jgi:hypothetical protein
MASYAGVELGTVSSEDRLVYWAFTQQPPR